jgi:hypothetical protein
VSYRIRLRLPLSGEEQWAAMRLHALCGVPIPDGHDVSFAPVSLSADQVAQLTEDEQAVRRKIRGQFGCDIRAIFLDIVE